MINYTQATLLAFGIAGILLHNLIKMDTLNKKEGVSFSFWKYLKMERFSILIALIIVAVAVVGSQEVRQLQLVGKWLGFGFLAIGYMGQSILIKYMGKASKAIRSDDNDK